MPSSVNVRLETNFDAQRAVPSRRQVKIALASAAEQMEESIRTRTARGVFRRGTPPRSKRYSTRPFYFEVPRGVRGVGRIRAVNRTRGRKPSARFIKLDRGYAEFRSLLRGEAFSTGPVTLELTGRMMRTMKGVVKGNRASIDFPDSRVSGQRRSPRFLAMIHNVRGTPSADGRLRREFTYITRSDAEIIVGRALRKAGLAYLRRI